MRLNEQRVQHGNAHVTPPCRLGTESPARVPGGRCELLLLLWRWGGGCRTAWTDWMISLRAAGVGAVCFVLEEEEVEEDMASA